MVFSLLSATELTIGHLEIAIAIIYHLCNSIHLKHPELRHRKNWLLLHKDGPAHHSVLVQEKLAKQQVTILPHPPYSPDLTPCNFFFFPRLKEKLHGHRIKYNTYFQFIVFVPWHLKQTSLYTLFPISLFESCARIKMFTKDLTGYIWRWHTEDNLKMTVNGSAHN
jgi:hypothetical protein